MDPNKQRTTRDIRPGRSMDGVRPSGSQARPMPVQNSRPSRPVLTSAPPAEDKSPQVVASPQFTAPPPQKARVVEPKPTSLPVSNAPMTDQVKPKRRLIKAVVKLVVVLVVVGLLVAGGLVIYTNYFK